MKPSDFYDQVWRGKTGPAAAPTKQRDWFHRYVLDHLVDPLENPRGQVVLELMADPAGRLLDVGCGKGDLITAALAGGRCRDAVGIDIGEPAVAIARKRGLDARVHDLNESALPFQDQSFDCVTLMAVLEHVFDPLFAVSEIYRVLKPNGSLILAVPNAASFSNRARLLFGRGLVTSLDPGWDGGHLHYFTVHSLTALLRDHAFSIERIAGSGAGRRWRELWPSLLIGELLLRCRK
jgi:methionine biosynthesis protein MetW